MTWRMPAEWEQHEATWLAWPSAGYTLGQYETEHEAARKVWASVANAASDYEHVSMVCHPGQESVARKYLSSQIDIQIAPLDDAWMRDIGPTFVVDSTSQKLGAVDWIFNGWGAQDWATWENDQAIGKFVARQTNSTLISSQLINEGGGIHVNGAGTVLLTETVQLGPGRNNRLPRETVEAEIHLALGTERAVWLKRGLTRDYEEFGTKGHVDIVACFSDANTILFHKQEDRDHPDFVVSLEIEEALRSQTDFRLVPISAPTQTKDNGGWVDYSYINHYVLNNAVLLCAFDDRNDARAKEMLQDAYPGRDVRLLDARELFARGGGIHCITQQQPATKP